MPKTFTKRIYWGHPDSQATFQVKAYVFGDGLLKQYRHEFEDFGTRGKVQLRPVGRGSVNFELVIKFVLYAAEKRLMPQYNPRTQKFENPVAVEKYTGSFRQTYKIGYSFGDNEPLKLDYRDLVLDRQAEERKDDIQGSATVFGLKNTEIFVEDGSSSTSQPYVMLKPTFGFLKDSTAKSKQDNWGVGVSGPKGGPSANYSHSESSTTTTNPADVDEKWGSLRLDINVVPASLADIKVPVIATPTELLRHPVVFAVGQHHANETQLNFFQVRWLDPLIQKAEPIYNAIRDGKIPMFVTGYASEPGTPQDNFELSRKRAESVAAVLKNRIPGGKLNIVQIPAGEGTAAVKGKAMAEQRAVIEIKAEDARSVMMRAAR